MSHIINNIENTCYAIKNVIINNILCKMAYLRFNLSNICRQTYDDIIQYHMVYPVYIIDISSIIIFVASIYYICYKINIAYGGTQNINKYFCLNWEFKKNGVEYKIISEPRKQLFFLEKSIYDKIIYTSGNKIHKITKRIHYVLDNINKMNGDSIKTYNVYNELEIEVLTQYLACSGMQYIIYVEWFVDNDNKILTPKEYKRMLIPKNLTSTFKFEIINMNKFRTNKMQYSQYFTRECDKLEYNKIKKKYCIKIKVSNNNFLKII